MALGIGCAIGYLPALDQPKSASHHSRKSVKQTMDLTVVGYIEMADGIGRQPVDLIEILRDDATISFLHPGRLKKQQIDLLAPSVKKIVHRSGLSHPGRVLIDEEVLSYPPKDRQVKVAYWKHLKLPEQNKRQIRFAYTMFESSRVPQDWVSIINHSFDGIIVPDPFLVEAYRESGVRKPIFVIPLGRDLSGFLASPLKAAHGSPMVFANYSTCIPRKNLVTLVRAFGDAFGNSEDVRLDLRWRYCDKGYREELLKEINNRGFTNICIEEEAVDDETYRKQFLNVDCYVNLATGEGFSIQPREAMALGIPVIVTNNTGQKTICGSGLVRSVPSNITKPAVYIFPGNFGLQYQCRVSDVVAAFKDVYQHYDKWLQKGSQAREWAAQYQRERMAPMYLNLIKPKRVVVGPENKILEDGIMTTSRSLARKYKKIFKRRQMGS
jgi:glycosyltransferase involved in cell wall biosynthesis